jgi:hypothetical protein
MIKTKILNGGLKMAKAPTAKKKVASKKAATKKVVSKKTAPAMSQAPQKNAFEEKFGEGTAFDLDYGKLLIIALCVYIAVQVS